MLERWVDDAGRRDRRASSRGDLARRRSRSGTALGKPRARAAARRRCVSWVKKRRARAATTRVALEGFVEALEEARRRLRPRLGRAAHRSGGARRAGFAGTDVIAARHRAPGRVGEAPAREAAERAGRRGRQADARLRRPAGRPRRGRSGGPVRRRGRSDAAAPRASSSAAAGRARRRRDDLYEHVAIDEAQDRSALEVKVLVEAVRAPDSDPTKRSVTIAGDTAQRLVFDNNFTGWAELLAADRPARDCPAAQAVVSLDRRGHAARARDPRSRARARRAARRASRRAGRAPRVRRPRRGRRVPRRRAAQPDGARADRVVRRDLAPRRAGRRVLRRPAPRRGPRAAPRAPRRVQLPARRRRHRHRAASRASSSTTSSWSTSTTRAIPTALGAAPAAHRRHARRAPAVAGVDRRAERR